MATLAPAVRAPAPAAAAAAAAAAAVAAAAPARLTRRKPTPQRQGVPDNAADGDDDAADAATAPALTPAARIAALEARVEALETALRTFFVAVAVASFFVTAVVAWGATLGGPETVYPVVAYMVVVTHRHDPLSIGQTLADNARRLLDPRRDIRATVLVLAWLLIVAALERFKLWTSSGTPPSLVVFSVVFIVVFEVPKLLGLLRAARRTAAPASSSSLASTYWPQLRFVLLAVGVVCALVVTDALVSAVLTRLFRSRECVSLLPTDHESVGGDTATREDDFNPVDAMGSFYDWLGSKATALAPLSAAQRRVASFPSVTWARVAGKRVLDFASGLGEVPRSLPAFVALMASTHVVVPDRYWLLRRMTHRVVAAAVIAGAVSALLKVLVHRFRPAAFGDPLLALGPRATVVDHTAFSKLDLSFPCGHTSVTFAAAYCLASEVIDYIEWNRGVRSEAVSRLVTAATYALPACIVVSRVVDCVHWPSDAVAGCFLGTAVGWWVRRQPVPYEVPPSSWEVVETGEEADGVRNEGVNGARNGLGDDDDAKRKHD